MSQRLPQHNPPAHESPFVVPPIDKTQPPTQLRRSVFSDAVIARLLRWLNRRERPIASTITRVETPNDSREQHALFLKRWRETVTPWMAGIRWNVLALILLAIIFTRSQQDTPLVIEFGPSLLNVLDPSNDVALAPNTADTTTLPQVAVDDPQVTPTVETQPDEPTEAPTPQVTTQAIPIMLDGRDIGGRDAALETEGGTGLTEAAVQRGLEWLKKNQLPRGYWSLCGPYSGGVRVDGGENCVAATAMALLAFQGFGVTPNAEHPLLRPFAPCVKRGSEWLVKQQREDGLIFDEERSPVSHRFYTHALATIAISELATMTNDAHLREVATKAIDYLIKHQSVAGGWRYGWKYANDTVTLDSDLSVTGWAVMALKSGEACGVYVPTETFARVSKFLDSVEENGYYRYTPSERTNQFAMTAEGTLCRLLIEPQTPERAAAMENVFDFLTGPANLIHAGTDSRDIYGWYYATQAIHFGSREHWAIWNGAMRESLVASQERSGIETGSWSSRGDEWGDSGGRLYATVFSILMLETYYRHRVVK
ncbi:MAG: prenyltransferase/squalene oxidase repeat-containing protein [Thermoguttaceae bacterium]